MTQNWFVVQVLSGHEKKVKRALDENRENHGMSERVHEVVVPIENVIEVKQGEQKVKEKVLWPGYVLVSMELDDDCWHFVKNTNGVIDFLGGGKPSPLKTYEVEEILNDLRARKNEVVHKHDISVGDTVKIVDGVFVNFTGTVTEMFQEKGRVSVLVSIFGRDTRVDDLEFWQIEKVATD